MSQLSDPQPDEERYSSEDDYNFKVESKRGLVARWEQNIAAADKHFKEWADKFKVEMLYQYFEGFQWFFITDENNRPYVMNMIHATIENKLPGLIFENAQFQLRAAPRGLMWDQESAATKTQAKEDALNFVAARPEFSLNDKHELAILDAFFGFGVIEIGYSDEPGENPYIPLSGKQGDFDCLYSKQIPFDQFRVSANANWDLSQGQWCGYYEFVPYNRLEKYKNKLEMPEDKLSEADVQSTSDPATGKVNVATDTQLSTQVLGPANHHKIWKIWDFSTQKILVFCFETCNNNKSDCLLESYDMDDSNTIHTMRFGKRRKGWYPYPPVWNWIPPQDEINDTRQAQRTHRKRYTRKYLAVKGKFENEEEIDKFLYGPDGTVIMVNSLDAIKPVEDAPLDPVDSQSLILSYDDFSRAAGQQDEYRGVQVSNNRTTATQAGIMDRRAQVREAKDTMLVGNFMCSIGRGILKALRKVKKGFWVKAQLDPENFLGELKPENYTYKRIPAKLLRDEDYDINLNVTSVSPISNQQDKQSFMEFLAMITQYEILAFSPALLREAAYKCGYKNESVLNQLQQWAQLAAIGRQAQLKQAVAPQVPGTDGQQPTPPGQLPQQQMAASGNPDAEDIMNRIFNRQGVQG